MKEKMTSLYPSNYDNIDIWSYADSKVQSLQLKDTSLLLRYIAVVNIAENRIIRLEQKNDLVTAKDSLMQTMQLMQHLKKCKRQ